MLDEVRLSDMKCHDINQLSTYLNLGTASARQLAEEAGATIHLGKRILFNVQKINDYIDSISE
jgi:hypothetical protein